MTIVGVVGDVRTAGPQRPAQAEIYMPYEQHPGPATALNIVARTELPDPLPLTDTMRAQDQRAQPRRAGPGVDDGGDAARRRRRRRGSRRSCWSCSPAWRCCSRWPASTA